MEFVDINTLLIGTATVMVPVQSNKNGLISMDYSNAITYSVPATFTNSASNGFKFAEYGLNIADDNKYAFCGYHTEIKANRRIKDDLTGRIYEIKRVLDGHLDGHLELICAPMVGE